MNLTLRFNTLTRYLIPLSLFYLALAQVIFFVGWLKWYLALCCVGLVVLPLVTSIREIDQIVGVDQEQSDRILFGVHHVILVLLISTLLLSISGIGGYGYQDTDWLKHSCDVTANHRIHLVMHHVTANRRHSIVTWCQQIVDIRALVTANLLLQIALLARQRIWEFFDQLAFMVNFHSLMLGENGGLNILILETFANLE